MKSAAAAQRKDRLERLTAAARPPRIAAQERLRPGAAIVERAAVRAEAGIAAATDRAVRPAPSAALPVGQTEEEARLLGEYNLYNG